MALPNMDKPEVMVAKKPLLWFFLGLPISLKCKPKFEDPKRPTEDRTESEKESEIPKTTNWGVEDETTIKEKRERESGEEELKIEGGWGRGKICDFREERGREVEFGGGFSSAPSSAQWKGRVSK